MTRKTAMIVCPGRGAYQADELGYLRRYHSDRQRFIDGVDDYRNSQGQETISALDGADRFVRSRHTTGQNASLLIYACAYADFLAINRDKFDIVAVAGNSMGWYLSLACSQALDERGAMTLINTMGTMMHNQGVGGQILYPIVDKDWRPDARKLAHVTDTITRARNGGHQVFPSIHLGGTAVLAGDDGGIDFLLKELTPEDRYPMALGYHAAFHTPLLDFIVPQAQEQLAPTLFHQPELPMIDGRGHIWFPGASDNDALYSYTLGTQINHVYDFTSSIHVGLKEFAPEVIIVLGPGATMGPPTAQSVIELGWYGMGSKTAFKDRQKSDPVILSMGIDDQRALVV